MKCIINKVEILSSELQEMGPDSGWKLFSKLKFMKCKNYHCDNGGVGSDDDVGCDSNAKYKSFHSLIIYSGHKLH